MKTTKTATKGNTMSGKFTGYGEAHSDLKQTAAALMAARTHLGNLNRKDQQRGDDLLWAAYMAAEKGMCDIELKYEAWAAG